MPLASTILRSRTLFFMPRSYKAFSLGISSCSTATMSYQFKNIWFKTETHSKCEESEWMEGLGGDRFGIVSLSATFLLIGYWMQLNKQQLTVTSSRIITCIKLVSSPVNYKCMIICCNPNRSRWSVNSTPIRLKYWGRPFHISCKEVLSSRSTRRLKWLLARTDEPSGIPACSRSRCEWLHCCAHSGVQLKERKGC